MKHKNTKTIYQCLIKFTLLLCGKEIIRYDEKYAYIKTREIKPLHEKSICTAEDLAKEAFPMAIWRDDTQYDLCPKCRKEFKRFMRNE